MASPADYWVGATIAEGGGALGTTVVCGIHKRSQLAVAVKCVPKAALARHPAAAVRLVGEQKILKRLSDHHHRGPRRSNSNSSDEEDSSNRPFVKLYASFHDAHCVYLVTELCCGGTLQDLIGVAAKDDDHDDDDDDNRDNQSSGGGCWRAHYGLQILRAVTALHRLGIVHGDLKPANVLLTARGRVKLADFGSAAVVPAAAAAAAAGNQPSSSVVASSSGSSSSALPRGSPGYAAPELVRSPNGDGGVTAAADLWSLGCLYFGLWTGSSPFDREGGGGGSSEALMVQRSQEYCALASDDDTARTAFLFAANGETATTATTPEDAAAVAARDGGSSSKPAGGEPSSSSSSVLSSSPRNHRAARIPAPWKRLIASLLHPTPSERAGAADQDGDGDDAGRSLYPSLHQLDLWKGVDTAHTLPGRLPPVPQWWIEQQQQQQQQQEEQDNNNNNTKLKDGAAGWSAFLV